MLAIKNFHFGDGYTSKGCCFFAYYNVYVFKTFWVSFLVMYMYLVSLVVDLKKKMFSIQKRINENIF